MGKTGKTDPGDPGGAAWRGWFRLPLRPAELHAKGAAMAAHVSQVLPLSGLPGDEVLLAPGFRAHFERTWETFAWHPANVPATNAPSAAPSAAKSAAPSVTQSEGDGGSPRPYAAGDAERLFDAVHARDTDPWHYTSSWYEHRKRALTLAALPAGSYTAGLEIGCSIGTLSVELAPRCESFLAVDASSAALADAARRLAHLPAARTRHLTVPNEWPDGPFDLIVVSEVGYYLSPTELAGLFDRIEDSLMPVGPHALPLAAPSFRLGTRRRLGPRRGPAAAGLDRRRDLPGTRLCP